MALKIRRGGAWERISSNATGLIVSTANGALSAGDPVIINSDGSVSKVEQQTATEVITELNPPVTQGSEATFTFADDDLIFKGARIAYVPDGDYYIICYVFEESINDDFLRVRAATVNSTGTITYGPEYEFHSENTTTSTSTGEDCDEFTLVCDPDIKNSANQDHDAVLVFYKGDNDKSYTKYVWSTDGTSLSFGDDVEVLDYDIKSLAIDYNKGIKKFMLTYVSNSNPHKLEVRLGTPTTNSNGGKVNFSSATEIYNGSSIFTRGVGIVADKTSGFIVMHNELFAGSGSYSSGDTRRALYGIDVDGTTLDVGSVTYLSEYTGDDGGDDEVESWVNLCVFHEEKGKFVYIFHGKKLGTGATEQPDILMAVLTLSGNSISYSTQYTVYEPGSYPNGSLKDYASLVYDPYLKEVYAHWSHTYGSNDTSNNLLINKISIDSITEPYWTNTITHDDGDDGGEVTVYDHTVDSEGNIFVCGGVKLNDPNPTNAIEGFIYKISGSGDLIKSIQYDPDSDYTVSSPFTGIVSDSSGNVYANSTKGICCKYNSDLDLQWATKTDWVNGNTIGNGNEFITNGGCIQLVSDSTIRIAGSYLSDGATAKFDISTSNGTYSSGYYNTKNGGSVSWRGCSLTGGDMYLCGYTSSSSGTGSDYYWVINGGAGFTNSYRFYNDGTDCVARCIVKDTVNNRTYIGGDMGGNGMITRVDNYNTTTTNQGTIWWKELDSSDVMDMALDSSKNLYAIQSNGTLLKINPIDGTLIFAKTLSGSLSKITIDSNDNIWINSDGSDSAITIYKLPTDGSGVGNCNYSTNTSSTLTSYTYQSQDQSRIQYATMGGSFDATAVWDGLQSLDDGDDVTTITPSSSKCDFPSESIIGTRTTYWSGNVGTYSATANQYVIMNRVGADPNIRSGMARFAAAGKTHHLCVFKNKSSGSTSPYDPGSTKAVKIQSAVPTSVTSNLTSTNFLGFSEAAYANSDIVRINIVGSVNKNQSGLTIGEKYYVQTDGTLSTTSGNPRVEAGIALSPTTLLINGGGVLGNEGYPSFTTDGWRLPF